MVARMRNRRQRVAISQAEIRKKCKLFGPLAEGTRAFREGCLRNDNPHNGKDRQAWDQGWCMAQEKENESIE